MTKLEEEIEKEIVQAELISPFKRLPTEYIAKAAAEVAKRYIEKAFNAGEKYALKEIGASHYQDAIDKDEFLESEGITEQPGIVVSNGITSTEDER